MCQNSDALNCISEVFWDSAGCRVQSIILKIIITCYFQYQFDGFEEDWQEMSSWFQIFWHSLHRHKNEWTNSLYYSAIYRPHICSCMTCLWEESRMHTHTSSLLNLIHAVKHSFSMWGYEQGCDCTTHVLSE